MALAAIDWLRDGLAGTHARDIDLGVALAASDSFGLARAGNLGGTHQHGAAIVGLQILVGVAAHAIGVGHALRVKNVADLVGLVAIQAGREDVGLFLPEFAADGLAVHHFDFSVALGAGGGDVAPVDGRIGIGVRQDVVRGVADTQVAATIRPFLRTASPWMLSE